MLQGFRTWMEEHYGSVQNVPHSALNDKVRHIAFKVSRRRRRRRRSRCGVGWSETVLCSLITYPLPSVAEHHMVKHGVIQSFVNTDILLDHVHKL